MRVLILRPAPDHARTAEAVAAMGHQPVVVPLFEVVPLDWTPPDPAGFDAVAMTSANAARHGGAALARYRHLPLFAVGEATATAARGAGFADITTGPGDARDLVPLLSGKRVLHVFGTEGQPLLKTQALAVYTARRRELSAGELRQLACPVALVHSPRAGTALAELAPNPPATAIVAISAAAAQACGPGWRSVTVAPHPREVAMLASLAKLCEANSATVAG